MFSLWGKPVRDGTAPAATSQTASVRKKGLPPYYIQDNKKCDFEYLLRESVNENNPLQN